MPILQHQPDIYPQTLLDADFLEQRTESNWWIASTRPRGEKKLITRLAQREIPHYCPLYEKRYRSPAGRIRTSYNPLFPNYVFINSTETERYSALTTDQICRMVHVVDEAQLIAELRQVQSAIESGIPLTPESKLLPGSRVRVKNGPFRGFEGQVIRREGKTRLLLTIAFLESGVSMELDECQVVPV